MWEASKTVNPDGTVTVTKLAGMAILGAAGATIINSLFSSDAWNNVTLLQEKLKNLKEYSSQFVSWNPDCNCYLCFSSGLFGFVTNARNSNAADIANNGIMFASNDRVGAAAASMIMGNVGVL
jgi:APA family basic amino acid/polyamine antiporter